MLPVTFIIILVCLVFSSLHQSSIFLRQFVILYSSTRLFVILALAFIFSSPLFSRIVSLFNLCSLHKMPRVFHEISSSYLRPKIIKPYKNKSLKHAEVNGRCPAQKKCKWPVGQPRNAEQTNFQQNLEGSTENWQLHNS